VDDFQVQLKLNFDDNNQLSGFLGLHNENINVVEEYFPINLTVRGNDIFLKGQKEDVDRAQIFLVKLKDAFRQYSVFLPSDVKYLLDLFNTGELSSFAGDDILCVNLNGKQIRARNLSQKLYVENMKKHDVVFAIGPAGTGKTYLAVAMAVLAFKNKEVNRIVLTRPAVEAGEKLGFLPGDLQDKVDPYLRPLYDSLYDMMEFEKIQRLKEKGAIEIAPLAFMRGRSLNSSFIILDEAQNTSSEQMKMFLTRLGYGSKAIITGDITQIDLPSGYRSGLVEAQTILDSIDGISFCYFTERDVVRHELVKKIIKAYDRRE